MLDLTKLHFPKFSELAADFELEEVLPGASEAQIAEIEAEVGIPLPESYKRLLRCARGFWLMGGVVQFEPPRVLRRLAGLSQASTAEA